MPLFHPRVLERHAQHVPLNPQHLEILTRWAENVRFDIFDVETQSDARFIQRILIAFRTIISGNTHYVNI